MGSLNAAATVALKPSIFDHFSNIISMLNDEPESGDQLRFARDYGYKAEKRTL